MLSSIIGATFMDSNSIAKMLYSGLMYYLVHHLGQLLVKSNKSLPAEELLLSRGCAAFLLQPVVDLLLSFIFYLLIFIFYLGAVQIFLTSPS